MSYTRIEVGKHNHIPDNLFDKEQLEKGIDVEYEHTSEREIAKAIAKDHLMEGDNYYILLEEMEKKLKEPKNQKNQKKSET